MHAHLGRVCCLTYKSYADAFFLVRSWVKKSRSALDFHDAPIERASLCPSGRPRLDNVAVFRKYGYVGTAAHAGTRKSGRSAARKTMKLTKIALPKPILLASRPLAQRPFTHICENLPLLKITGYRTPVLGIALRKSVGQHRSPVPRMPAACDLFDRFCVYIDLPGTAFARSGKKCQLHIVSLFFRPPIASFKDTVSLDDAFSCL